MVAYRSTTKRKKAPSENLMMKLPGELRNRIYESALLVDTDVEVRSRRSPSQPHKMVQQATKKLRWHEPGLLQASKQIRAEASGVYYGGNQFVVYAHPAELRRSFWFLAAKSTKGDRKYEDDVSLRYTIRLLGARWEDTAHWGLLTALAYHSITVTHTPDVQNFVTGNFGEYVGQAIEEVMKIGYKARARELSLECALEDFLDWAGSKASAFHKYSPQTANRIRASVQKLLSK